MSEEGPKVVSLHGVPLAGQPNPTIIKNLEDSLERARAGQIEAIIIAEALPGGNYTSWFQWANGAFPLCAVAMLRLNIRFNDYVKTNGETT